MKIFHPLLKIIILLIVLLVRPSAILTQFYNGYNSNQPTFNGYYLPYYYTNGLGFCYTPTPYCLYNYVPPNFLCKKKFF